MTKRTSTSYVCTLDVNSVADMHREKLLRQRDAGNHDGIIIYNSDYNKIPDYITDEEIISLANSAPWHGTDLDIVAFARIIEERHGIK